DIHDIVQEYDKFISGTIVQEFERPGDKNFYELRRKITIKNGNSLIQYKAFEIGSGEPTEIPITRFNVLFDKNYVEKEIKPYEVMINVDSGQDFFKDSRKLLNAEMEVFNTIEEEIEKTKTRIATSQHYQT